LFVSIACSESFEKIRNSGDPDLILSKADAYYEDENWANAQILYEQLLGSFRGKNKAERIFYNFADTYFQQGQYILSSYHFKRFAVTYPNSILRPDADFMVAYSEYKQSPKFRLDQEPTERAMEAFQEFINRYPTSDRVAECNQLMDELRVKLEKKSFEASKLYYDMREYQSAAHTFKNFVRDFPDSDRIDYARYLACKSEYLLAANSIPEKQFERYEQVIKDFEAFQEKHGDSRYIEELKEYSNISKEKINQLSNG
jgi:outer membrane protein assembly factor BamD